jgi:hypothetical protein
VSKIMLGEGKSKLYGVDCLEENGDYGVFCEGNPINTVTLYSFNVHTLLACDPPGDLREQCRIDGGISHTVVDVKEPSLKFFVEDLFGVAKKPIETKDYEPKSVRKTVYKWARPGQRY